MATTAGVLAITAGTAFLHLGGPVGGGTVLEISEGCRHSEAPPPSLPLIQPTPSQGEEPPPSAKDNWRL
jgi:hypothetical protein